MGRRLHHIMGHAVYEEHRGFRIEPEGTNTYDWSNRLIQLYPYKDAVLKARSCGAKAVMVHIKIVEEAK